MTTILTPTASDITPLLNLRLKVTIAASGAGATLIAERTVEASLWSFDTITGFLVLSSLDPPLSSSSSSSSTATTPIPNPSSDATSASPAPSAKRSYHFVKSNQIKSVVVLSPVPDASLIELEAALKQISFVDVEVRVEKAVKEEIKQRARIGEGVSAEAQELFDNLARTLPVRWSKEEIIVMDEVIISPPYGAANVKGAKGTGERVERVKKVVRLGVDPSFFLLAAPISDIFCIR